MSFAILIKLMVSVVVLTMPLAAQLNVLPRTDTEKIADALQGGPAYIAECGCFGLAHFTKWHLSRVAARYQRLDVPANLTKTPARMR